MAQLHNSLWNLDNAKNLWATETNQPEAAIPSLEELAPYLGEWKSRIEQLQKMGIEYKITSREENQSDVATLTRGIRFRAGICCFYVPGTSLSLHSGWQHPTFSASPITLRIRLTWLHAQFFLIIGILVLLLVNVIVFFVRRATTPKEIVSAQGRDFASISPSALSKANVVSGDLYLPILGCLFCLLGLGFISIVSPPGDRLIQKLGSHLGLVVTGVSLLLPMLVGFRFLKKKQLSSAVKQLLLMGFLFSLIPAALIAWTYCSTLTVTLPGHVKESDTKRVVNGMSKAEVVQALGSPCGSSSGDHKERLTYDFQVPWGASGRQFFVDLIDDKVVAGKIVRYGGDPGDDFWMSDDFKDLLAGKAVPNNAEIQQACLAGCKQEFQGTQEVTVSDTDVCLLEDFKHVKATGHVVLKQIADGKPSTLDRHFKIVMVKGPTGWQSTNFEFSEPD